MEPTHKDAIMSLLSSCFPCRSEPPALPPSPRLQALLTDPESDSDAMSLHSTYRPHTRKRKKPTMQLCGVNLFGKSKGQIRLDDEDEEPINRPIRPRYDSDAAPLPDATIHSLATGDSPAPTPTTEQPRRHESPEEELARLRAEKAARKARRRDRRERKARAQLALESTADFEGYPGSGYHEQLPISPPSTTTSTPGIDEVMSDLRVDDDPEDVEADMGAAVYTRSSGRSLGSSSSSGTGTGTGTSASGRRSSLGPGFSANNALGLRSPLSPLAQSYTPGSPRPEPVVPESAEPAVAPQPVVAQSTESLVETSAPVVDAPKESDDSLLESTMLPITSVKAPHIPIEDAASNSNGKKPASQVSEPATPKLSDSTSSLADPTTPKLSDSTPSLKPSDSTPNLKSEKLVPRLSIPRKISLSNLPMSSPGAGPGPRTMENSPRLAQLPNISNSPKTTGYGFPSPGLSRSGMGGLGMGGFPSPGLGKSSLGGGFPSPGLGLGLGLTHHSALSSSGAPSPRVGNGSGQGAAHLSSGSGAGVHGSGGNGGGGGGAAFGSGRVTAGMGVALANRGD